MEFRISDTFTDSLANFAGEEQKAVKTAAFDLQVNPAHPSLQSTGERFYRSHFGPPQFVTSEALVDLLRAALEATGGTKFSMPFLLSEWQHNRRCMAFGDLGPVPRGEPLGAQDAAIRSAACRVVDDLREGPRGVAAQEVGNAAGDV